MYKNISRKMIWQVMRRFESGVAVFAKGKDGNYYKIPNPRALVKACQNGNVYIKNNRP